MYMDKPLKFWNGEKVQKNIFNDSLGNVIKFAVWTGSKSASVIRAVVIKRNVYKIVTMRDKEGISDNNNKKYEFKLPDVEESRLVGTQTVDWNPEHESQIAVGMANSYVLHWNIETAKCIRMQKSTHDSRPLTCIQWSRRDPNILIYGTKDPIIKVWDVRQESTVMEEIQDGALDIKFDPFDGNQFAVASENHEVMIYDLRYPSSEKARSAERKPQVSQKFKFSAHENRTFKCEWNPNVRNRLATSGKNSIKIWDLDYAQECHLQQEHTRITTRQAAYSIKWSPLCENLLASHSHSSKYVEIWDINRSFRPYRHFKEEPTLKDGWNQQSKLAKLLLHWHESPHALITLNTSNADLSMHARRDAINMENFAPSCAVSCSPHHEIGFTVTSYKSNKRVSRIRTKSEGNKEQGFTLDQSLVERLTL